MKHYVKNLYDFSKPNSIPTFTAQREEFTCPFCERRVLIAVPTTGIDWERIANQYKGYAEQMWRDANLLLAEAGVDTLLEQKLKDILERCKRSLENRQ